MSGKSGPTQGGQGHDVCIAGGGITGLAAAFFLVQMAKAHGRPLRVTIIEASDRVGGKIATYTDGDVVLELGPDSVLRRKPWAVDLARQLGLGDQLVGNNRDAAKMYTIHRGRLEPLPDGLLLGAPADLSGLLDTPLLSWPGKIRAALEPLLPPLNPRGGYTDETIASFARRRLGTEAARQLLEPVLKAPYAGQASQLSLMATYPWLRSLEEQHGNLTQGVRHMMEMMSGRGSQSSPSPFTSLKSGLESIVHRLQAVLESSAACRIVTGARVSRVEPSTGGRFRVHFCDKSASSSSSSENFDAVIITTPAFAAAQMLSSPVPELASRLEEIPYVSVGVIGLAFDRSQVGHPLDGSGILLPEDSPGLMSGCTWFSSKWPHSAPSNIALLRCFFKPDPFSSEEEIVTTILAELAPLLDIAGSPLWWKIQMWENSIPQYTLGHLQRAEAIDGIVTEYHGLSVAGAAFRGIGIPDCVRQGWEAAGRTAAHLWQITPKKGEIL